MPLAEPPEGVLVGESVPRENQQAELEEHAVQRLAAALKTRPRYRDYSEAERLEIAREKLQED